MSLPFTYVIGLEVHAELSTKTKMFCRCINAPFGAEPNEHTCPVCTGLPGTLPVPNFEAVRKAIILGRALGSTIPAFSKFDRKHYFYPDNPRGYQISQYDLPICQGGQLDLLNPAGEVEKTIHFERVHLEDDAGKLMHGSSPGYSLVDLNRAGVPLVEMVTKPDLTSPEEARRFLRELQLLVRTLGVSEADMEKGQMRCDVNVSLKFTHDGEQVWTPVTEIKNVNSTRAVERSLQVEAERLYAEWLAGGPIRDRKHKLTAGWDEDKEKITIQRTKEEANDYRYFPEPDIPPLMVYEVPELHPEHVELPELPNARRQRYLAAGVAAADIETLLQDPERLQRLEAIATHLSESQFKVVANWLINATDCLAFQKDEDIAELIGHVQEGKVAFAALKPQLKELANEREEHPQTVILELLQKHNLLQIHDDSVVQSAIAEVLAAQPQAVAQYQAGETKVLGFLTGQVMQRAKGQAQAARVQEMLKEALEK